MALKQADVEYLLTDIAEYRAHYSYLPEGMPSDWRTGKPLGNWQDLLQPAHREASPPICSQALVREFERRYINAASMEEKAQAVWLVRCWKTQRRVNFFAKQYKGNKEDLASIWEKSAEVAERPERLGGLSRPEIALASASAFAAFASRSRSLGVLDVVMAYAWTQHGWARFKLRKDKLGKVDYLPDLPDNWRLYPEYIRDLQQLAEAATGLHFVDASTGQSCAFSPRDIEMALYQRFGKGGSR